MFFAIVRDARSSPGEGAGDGDFGVYDAGGIGGARYMVGEICPIFGFTIGCLFILPGDGRGEFIDLSCSTSNLRNLSISAFFLRCSAMKEDAETSSLDGFGTVREILAAASTSISRTSSRSRVRLSAACSTLKIM